MRRWSNPYKESLESVCRARQLADAEYTPWTDFVVEGANSVEGLRHTECLLKSLSVVSWIGHASGKDLRPSEGKLVTTREDAAQLLLDHLHVLQHSMMDRAAREADGGVQTVMIGEGGDDYGDDDDGHGDEDEDQSPEMAVPREMDRPAKEEEEGSGCILS